LPKGASLHQGTIALVSMLRLTRDSLLGGCFPAVSVSASGHSRTAPEHPSIETLPKLVENAKCLSQAIKQVHRT
jgi:hypothetical protein